MKLAIRLSILALVLCPPLGAWAQAPTTSPPQTVAPVANEAPLKPPELDALVAPIALYPDALLANILMASTYPLEVVQAKRWVDQNSKLNGDALQAAAAQQDWDDSVKALVATPAVLETMSDKLDWAQKLGDAFLAQQTDVMDAIQRLRDRAYDNKKLSSNAQQVVTVTEDQGKQVIQIAPASAEQISVPYYDPAVVYGEWPYSDYPAYPYAWPAPGYLGAGVLATGLAFGSAYALGRWGTGGGNYWRGNINWRNNDINIGSGNRVTHWQHNPQHRQGVRYGSSNVQQKFGGGAAARAGADFRGGGGQQVLKPGGDRGRAADRATAADRAKTGNRANAGDRAKAGDRGKGSAGNRAAANRTNAAGKGGQKRQAAAGGRSGGAKHASAGHRGSAGSVGRAGGARGGAPRASFASAGRVGGAHMGGGPRAGGGVRGGGGRGGGGRRSDIYLKHDVVLVGHLQNGVGLYRFAYNGSDKAYVGVIAQDVQRVMPAAVLRGSDGYLRVRYERLGLTLQTFEQWLAGRNGAPPMH